MHIYMELDELQLQVRDWPLVELKSMHIYLNIMVFSSVGGLPGYLFVCLSDLLTVLFGSQPGPSMYFLLEIKG